MKKLNLRTGSQRVENAIKGDKRKMKDEEIKEYWRTAYYNEKHKNEDLEKENAELKKQIVDLKDYVFKVSKFFIITTM